ncbi:MAG: tetratricopeptide repeat protein [Desulfopila sp.]
MKKTFRYIFAVAALPLLLSQCATQDEVQRLQYQLQVVNKKLTDMQRSTVGDIQKQQAASANEIDTLEQQIASLKGQLEETDMQNRLLKEQNDALQSNIGNVAKEEAQRREEALTKISAEQQAKQALIVELNQKLKAQEESLQEIQNARVREAERRADEAKLKADEAKARVLATTSAGTDRVTHITTNQSKRIVSGPAEPSAPTVTPSSRQPQQQTAAIEPVKTVEETPAPTATAPATTAAPPVNSAPEPALAGANQLYQQKQYGKAYSEFEKIASANPSSNDGISASYMMGECLYAQKEYDKAILQYQKIISQNGSSPQAASATLKQGMAFEQLADNETAKMIYKKLVTHYSSSPEAKIAKEKLDSL